MRRRMAVCATLVAALAAGAASGVDAQQRVESNKGLTWSLGFSKGSLKIDCSLACEAQKTGALGFVGHVGWTLRQNLVVGVEAMLWEKAQDLDGDLDDDNTNFNYVGVALQFYPHEFREFFAKIAVGVAKTKTEMDVPTFGASTVEATGFGFTVGTGWDFHFGKNWSITPFLDGMFAFKGKGDIDGASANVDFTSSMVQWGLKVVFH